MKVDGVNVDRRIVSTRGRFSSHADCLAATLKIVTQIDWMKSCGTEVQFDAVSSSLAWCLFRY